MESSPVGLRKGRRALKAIVAPGYEADGVAKIAPRSDWRDMGDAAHFVQFYEGDDSLLNSLSAYIGKALGGSEAGIVVATKTHREGLEARLKQDGLDLGAAIDCGLYVALDADETLSTFMVDGMPDSNRFTEVVGGLISRAADGRRRVRIFGEMVALLWAEGKYDAAINLEELWNALQKTHAFSLFCSYPMSGFGGQELSHRLNDVCSTHVRVIPAESYADLVNPDERLRAIIRLQQQARSLQAEIAERQEAEDALRSVKRELEVQLEAREQLLVREQLARAEAESANNMKDEFLATVSHELRTPLNAIIGWSHMLSEGRLDPPMTARALETIERNARSQAQLIEDILDASRVITGKLRLNIGPVDAASVINAALDSVQLAADAKAIQLEVTLDASVRHISGDAGRLQQIVWNLLSNAIKFTPAGGRVEVRLERADSDSPNVQIRVIDTGQGISANFLPFIFDRFRQADGTSTRRHGGLGLGLSIVRHLVELHGGTAHADSPGEGAGATFTVRLPVSVPRETVKARRVDSDSWQNQEIKGLLEPLPSLEGVQVLIVDDDNDSLQILTAMLTQYRAGIQSASSVAEALEVLRWFKPDVLVSDLAMPDEDGYSLITRVREMEARTGQQIPAVALTAFVRVEDRARALAAGFNLFVPKPVDCGELIVAISNLAETRHSGNSDGPDILTSNTIS